MKRELYALGMQFFIPNKHPLLNTMSILIIVITLTRRGHFPSDIFKYIFWNKNM